ncbi:MAG: bacteriohemerythrin [Rhodoblastus sp.]
MSLIASKCPILPLPSKGGLFYRAGYTFKYRQDLIFVKAWRSDRFIAEIMQDSIGQAAHPLGVALMDEDHAQLEALIARAEAAADDELAVLHRRIVQELEDHFSREEELMRTRGFPGLHCHYAQHRLLVEQAARVDAASPEAIRRHIGVHVAQAIESHVMTMDFMTAAFLRGDIGLKDFEGLRLPVEPGAS